MKYLILFGLLLWSHVDAKSQSLKFKGVPLDAEPEEMVKKFEAQKAVIKSVTSFGKYVFQMPFVKDTVDVYASMGEIYIYSQAYKSWPALKKGFNDFYLELKKQYGEADLYSEDYDSDFEIAVDRTQNVYKLGGKIYFAEWIKNNHNDRIQIKILPTCQVEISLTMYINDPDVDVDVDVKDLNP
jgi:hypothetical protein